MRLWARVSLVCLPGALAACSTTRAVTFEGRPQAGLSAQAEVFETSLLPRTASPLGRLSARCIPVDVHEGFSEQPLFNVDCTESRLRSLLHQAARDNGGDVLSEIGCHHDSGISCEARLGRLDPEARLPALVAVPPSFAEYASDSRVSFVPALARISRDARSGDSVGDRPLSSPSHIVLGELEATCSGCSEALTRDALRAAAGRLGASDVVGVRCASDGRGYRCLGQAAAPQSETAACGVPVHDD